MPPHKEWVVLLRRVPARVAPVPVVPAAELPVVTAAQPVAPPSNSAPVAPAVRVPAVLPLQAADAQVVVVVAAVDQVVEQPVPSDVAVPRASRVSQSARSGKSLKCRRLPPLAV